MNRLKNGRKLYKDREAQAMFYKLVKYCHKRDIHIIFDGKVGIMVSYKRYITETSPYDVKMIVGPEFVQ